jgi:hypothetical protein
LNPGYLAHSPSLPTEVYTQDWEYTHQPSEVKGNETHSDDRGKNPTIRQTPCEIIINNALIIEIISSLY